jgi:uncharacterized membrane protein
VAAVVGDKRLPTDYAKHMNESSSRSVGRMILAVLVLGVAAWVVLHFIVGIIAWLGGVIVVILAIVAVIWALRVLL